MRLIVVIAIIMILMVCSATDCSTITFKNGDPIVALVMWRNAVAATTAQKKRA